MIHPESVSGIQLANIGFLELVIYPPYGDRKSTSKLQAIFGQCVSKFPSHLTLTLTLGSPKSDEQRL